MTYKQRARDLFRMIEEGKLLDALDKYYHDDVMIIADDGVERNGKHQAREYDKYLLKEIEEVIGGGIRNVASNEDLRITMVEYWIELKFKNGNKKKLEEVAIQQWEGELVIRENFYSKRQ